MASRSKYKTKQRDFLLKFLESAEGHVTAADVCRYVEENGAPIGKSTVYRQLESLVDEGVINKYIIDPNSPACFEFAGAHVHHEAEVCFHCKCEKCGKLIHMHCDELEEIGTHLLNEHKFKLDPMRTVFYGVCEECS